MESLAFLLIILIFLLIDNFDLICLHYVVDYAILEKILEVIHYAQNKR